MPSFPSYYLNNLERKRQRSRELREGLNEGMAGVLGGVDRLAQMQQALEEKGLRAEALQHGREIEAQNQARADQRFAWEGEDRERKNAQADQKFWLELRKSATQGNAALGGGGEQESPAEDAAEQGEEPGDVLARMQGYLGGQEGGPGLREIAPVDDDAAAEAAAVGEPETTTSDILARLDSTLRESKPPLPSASVAPSNADRIEEERLRSMQLKNQLAERKLKGGGGAPGVTSKKELDRQLAELRLKAAEKKAAGGGVSTTDVDKVRREFNALPVVKQYQDVSIAVSKMKNAAKVPSAAGDLSLIFAFMKTLDPTSTVREGEFANAQNATGVPDRVVNEYNRVMSGERLNDAQRADFLAQADSFLAAHKNAYDAAAQAYGGLATRRGMEPGDVVMGGPAPSAGPLGDAPARDQGETRRAYYERLRAGGMDHQTALAAARGGQ